MQDESKENEDSKRHKCWKLDSCLLKQIYMYVYAHTYMQANAIKTIIQNNNSPKNETSVPITCFAMSVRRNAHQKRSNTFNDINDSLNAVHTLFTVSTSKKSNPKTTVGTVFANVSNRTKRSMQKK